MHGGGQTLKNMQVLTIKMPGGYRSSSSRGSLLIHIGTLQRRGSDRGSDNGFGGHQ